METEISPQMSWQNEGICSHYAEDKLNDYVLRSIYMAIVRRSFGYGKKSTNRISQEELAKASAITSRTLRDKIKILEEMKMVIVIPPDTKIKGGGSTSCAYAPDFPRGYGKLYLKDEQKESSNTKSKVPDKKEVTSYKNMYF